MFTSIYILTSHSNKQQTSAIIVDFIIKIWSIFAWKRLKETIILLLNSKQIVVEEKNIFQQN